MKKELRYSHHFTTPYSPLANGTVERECREAPRSCKALLSEWNPAPKDWPGVTGSVQTILNQSPLKRLGRRDGTNPRVYRTPLEFFTRIKPTRPLMRALPIVRYKQAKNESIVRAQFLEIEKIQSAHEEMHKDVEARVMKNRKRSIETHNRNTNIKKINFAEGDFVLVREAQKKDHMLRFLWKGSRSVLRARSELVYEMEDILTKKREVVHACQLTLYRCDMDGKEVTDALKRHIEHSTATYQDVQGLKDIRIVNEVFQILVELEGLQQPGEYTWEPILQLLEDIPQMLETYLRSPHKRCIKMKACSQLMV